MAVKIKSVDESIGNSGIKVLVHGPAGSGKTTLCATTGVPTLIISAESGLLAIKGAPDFIKVVEVTSIKDMGEILAGLKDGSIQYVDPDGEAYPFQWIALDSITEIAEKLLAAEKARSADPRQAYGALIDDMLELMKDFRDLPNYNVVMSCKQNRVKDEFAGTMLYEPAMPGTKLGPQIPYLFDEVFALRVEKDEEGKDYRVLQTNRDIRFEAKDRSGALDMFEKPSLKHIQSKITGA